MLTCKIQRQNYWKMGPLVTFSIDDDTEHGNWSGLEESCLLPRPKPIT